MRRPPAFWRADGTATARLLTPLSGLYTAAAAVRRMATRPYLCRLPVICVGNLTVGGAGKTPLAIEIAALLSEAGHQPHFLTRGYGGALQGPVRVDPTRHDFRAVGDEALLLARTAPTTLSRNRAAGARAIESAAEADGDKTVIIMDDGFQNPSLAKTLSILAVDGAAGFGNGRLLPAGPLREPVISGLRRANAVVVFGAENNAADLPLPLSAFRSPLLTAEITLNAGTTPPPGTRLFAFAGIGRPEKFRDGLLKAGLNIAAFRGFPDHHPYRRAEIGEIVGAAEKTDAQPVTTEKDHVRLPPDMAKRIVALPAGITWRGDDRRRLTEILLEGLRPWSNAAV